MYYRLANGDSGERINPAELMRFLESGIHANAK